MLQGCAIYMVSYVKGGMQTKGVLKHSVDILNTRTHQLIYMKISPQVGFQPNSLQFDAPSCIFWVSE